MRKFPILIALALVAAACGGDDGATTTAAAATTAAPATTTTVAMTTEATTSTTEAVTTTAAPAGDGGLQVTHVSFAEDWIVIQNFGTEAVDLDGFFLCQRPSYSALPALTLGAGEGLLVQLGDAAPSAPAGLIVADGVSSVGGLSPDGGEIGLYSSSSFGSSDAIVSYVEWGSSNHGRSGVAVGAGIWPAGGFVTTGGDSAAISSADGGPWEGPEDWSATG